jgi:hypothetical protein
MTSCCNEYGDCTQGATCPARTGVVLPHQAAHARRVADGAEQVARIKSSRPKWLDGKGTPVPPEAGNFQIVDLGPDDVDQPLDAAELKALVRTLLGWALAVAVMVGGVALAVGYATAAHAGVLWAFLQGVA